MINDKKAGNPRGASFFHFMALQQNLWVDIPVREVHTLYFSLSAFGSF